MDLPKPRTYNELMCYKRCLEMKKRVGDMDSALLAEVYTFIRQNRDNRIVVEGDMLMFTNNTGTVKESPVLLNRLFTRIVLTQAAIHMIPVPQVHSSGGDSGSSGNNNNNNNNNNA